MASSTTSETRARGVARAAPRRERTRARILEAAEAVFAEKGFAAARLEDVVRVVGIRRASLVYYFRGKQALYDAVLDAVFGEVVTRFEQILGTTAPLADRVERAVSAWVAYVGERPSVARILLREAAEASAARAAGARHVRPAIRALAAAIEEGQRAGVFRVIDPVQLIFTLVGATVFFVVATPALAPDWPFDPLDGAQMAAHQRTVRDITRRLLRPTARDAAGGGAAAPPPAEGALACR